MSEPKWSKREIGGVSLLLVAVLVWTIAPLQGFDFWFYLASGRAIWESHSIPWSESFLGTTKALAFGQYGGNAWGSDLYFYLFHKFGGVWGLVLSRSLLLTLITGITYLNCRLLGAQPWFAGWWACLGLWTIRSRFLVRSYFFSDLGLALTILCLLKYRNQPKLRLASLAFTFFLWSNLHQGIIAGWILIGIWALFGGTDIKEGLKTILVVGIAGLVRPYGWTFFAFLYDHFANQSAVQGVLEWGPLSPSAALTQLGPFLLVAASLVATHFVKTLERRRHPWHFLLIVIVFLFLAFRSQRGVAELLPVAFPLLIPFFHAPANKKWLIATSYAALVCAMLYTNPIPTWSRVNSLYPLYPERLSQISAKLPGQLFNSYEYGSFLAFHDQPPFIHGTTALFREQLVDDFQDILNPTPRREELIAKYGVKTFLLHSPKDNDVTEDLINYLYAHPDWKLVAWDDSGLLFTRGSATEGLVAVKPWAEKVRWRDPVAAKAELEKLIETTPSARAYIFLSQLATEQKDWPRVVELSQKAISLVPYSSQAWQSLAFAAFQQGDLKLALEGTKQAARWAPENPEIQFNRAFVLYQSQPDLSGLSGYLTKLKIRYHLNRVLEIAPDSGPALQLLHRIEL